MGGSVGHRTSSDGEAANTCGHGLEDRCIAGGIAGGTLIDKDMAYHNSFHAQDEANADCGIGILCSENSSCHLTFLTVLGHQWYSGCHWHLAAASYYYVSIRSNIYSASCNLHH